MTTRCPRCGKSGPAAKLKAHSADCQGKPYPKWQASYSGEAFDRTQALAAELTQADRLAGRKAPEVGYSSERFADAERIVRAAQQGSTDVRRR